MSAHWITECPEPEAWRVRLASRAESVGDCLIWAGKLDRDGYGVFRAGPRTTGTLTDLFCGAGGSAQGAHVVPGIELRLACPDCGAAHDPRPCARDGATCACCEAMYPDQAARAAASDALDGAA